MASLLVDAGQGADTVALPLLYSARQPAHFTPVLRSRALRTVARIALAAMLFSALSPAFAGVIFRGDASVLGRLLQIPERPAAQAHDDGATHAVDPAAHEHHAAHHDSSAHECDAAHHDHAAPSHPATHPAHHGQGGEHAAHGIYCSFCLASASVVAVTAGAAQHALAIVPAAAPAAPAERALLTLSAVRPTARGPPVPLR